MLRGRKSKGFYNQKSNNVISYGIIIGIIFLVSLIGSVTEGFITPVIIKILSNYFVIV